MLEVENPLHHRGVSSSTAPSPAAPLGLHISWEPSIWDLEPKAEVRICPEDVPISYGACVPIKLGEQAIL